MAPKKGRARKPTAPKGPRPARKQSPQQKQSSVSALSAKQQRFVEEYLVDLNATQAAIRAGYSAKTAEQQGPRLLGNVGVSAAIQAAKEKRAARTEITQDRVLEELSVLAFSNIDHYRIKSDDTIELAPGAPPTAIRAVASIKRRTIPQRMGDPIREVEIRLWDKPGPLKLAGRHVGLFPDRVELTGKNGGPIETKASEVDLTKLSESDLADLQRIVGLPKPA